MFGILFSMFFFAERSYRLMNTYRVLLIGICVVLVFFSRCFCDCDKTKSTEISIQFNSPNPQSSWSCTPKVPGDFKEAMCQLRGKWASNKQEKQNPNNRVGIITVKNDNCDNEYEDGVTYYWIDLNVNTSCSIELQTLANEASTVSASIYTEKDWCFSGADRIKWKGETSINKNQTHATLVLDYVL